MQGNLIGTNAAGTASLSGTTSFGIFITEGASDNVIGGTTPAARNVIAGNILTGILVRNSSGTRIEGNYLGTDVTGTAALGNNDGVAIENSTNNTIGGTASGAGNLLSGNRDDGASIFGSGSTGNLVQGNLVGTDASGTIALPNGDDGLTLSGAATGNTIGGSAPGARNVVASAPDDGVDISGGSSGNIVRGNFIGTDVTGMAALGNGGDGVLIEDSPDNTIGGPAAGAGNVISGNVDDGIFIIGPAATGNTIQGNLIGTQANGTSALGNGEDGIDFSSATPASDNTVGGIGSGEANVVAFNGARGVFVSGGTGNAILSNSIFANGGLGIDLGDAGVTPNDDGDGDTGPNNLQNFPVLTSATVEGGQTTVVGDLNSTASTTFRLEFFASAAADPSGNGEGRTFLGAEDVTTDASGDAGFNVVLPVVPPTGQTFISATATDPANNTSEFSATTEATLGAGQLLNISTRLRVLTGDNVLIGGFIILGTEPKDVIVRAIGPSLGDVGVADFLVDPVLELNFSDGSVVSNDNWKDTQEAEIMATGLAPTEEAESAILATLDPGAYTAIVRGVGGGTGVALVEAYDLEPAAGTTANISTRGFVDTGDNVMIGGFIAGSGGGGDATVLVRAIGPSLTAQGVPGALADPMLELYDGSGTQSHHQRRLDGHPASRDRSHRPGPDRRSRIGRSLHPRAGRLHRHCPRRRRYHGRRPGRSLSPRLSGTARDEGRRKKSSTDFAAKLFA